MLIGIDISQVIFWFGRSYIVYKYSLEGNEKEILTYWIKNVAYIVVFVAAYFITNYIYSLVRLSSLLSQFIIGGIISEIFIVILYFAVFGRTEESKQCVEMLKSAIIK